MTQLPDFLNLLPTVPLLLVHLTGVVVAIVLLVRQERRRTAAILTLIGFALLFVLDLANFGRAPLIGWLAHRTATGVRLANVGVGCCCSVLNVGAVVCLIIAIWQALASGRGPGTSASP